MQSVYQILNAMLDMIGQESVYAECGGDYERGDRICSASNEDCKHASDCRSQKTKVDQTKMIRAMIADLESPVKIDPVKSENAILRSELRRRIINHHQYENGCSRGVSERLADQEIAELIRKD